MRIISLFLIFFLATINSYSQKISSKDFKIKEASHTKWAGGPAGYHGDKYFITLTTKCPPSKVHPDTVWIEKKCFPLAYQDSLNKAVHQFNISVKDSNGISIFTIRLDQRFIENMNGNNPLDESGNEKKEESFLHFTYTGKALISYIRNGKRKYFEIMEFTENPSVAYP